MKRLPFISLRVVKRRLQLKVKTKYEVAINN